MKYDLVVAYRVYPGIAKIPPVYPTDKLKLTEICFKSFVSAVVGIRTKIYVLLDGCPDEYEKVFLDNFDNNDLVIIKLDKAGNKATFKKQIEILSCQNDSDIVYFAEDDYFYIKNIKNIVELLKNNKADFATPYEHPSSYSDDNVVRNRIIIYNNQRYISVQHACLTFMTTKRNLLNSKKFLLIFSNWFGSDFVVWGCMTLGWGYFKYFKLFFNYKNYNLSNLKVFGSLFIFSWYNFILNRKKRLFMPVETFATHMESNFLSPGIDWGKYFHDEKR